MKKGLLIMFIIFSVKLIMAQNTVKIVADDKIEDILKQKAALNTIAKERHFNGYRIQIYQGSVRKEATEAKTRFLNLFPEVNTYINYSPPNFKIRVGDYRYKFEAISLKKEMEKNGMENFMVVPDKIIYIKPW